MHWVIRTSFSALLGLLCLVPRSAGAEIPPLLALDWAIREALVRNPQIAAAWARWEATAAETLRVRSLDDPSLYTMFWAVPDHTPNPFAAHEIWLGIRQDFPYPGKLSLKARVAARAADIAGQDYLAVEEEVIHQVKMAYHDLFMIYKEIEITRQHLDLAREFSRIAETKYTTGMETQGDVLKALVEVSDLSNRIGVLIQRRKAAQAKLNILLDREPQAPLGAPATPSIRPVVFSLEKLQQMALANRPELKAAHLGIAQSEAVRALAQKDYYPDLRAELAYWNVRDRTNRWMLRLEAKVPIALWSKGKYDARVQQAAAEKRVWEAAHQELKNQILYQVEDALVELRVAADKVDLYDRVILPQARQAVETVKAGYRTDRETFLSLVDSEQMLLGFELDYYTAVADFEKGLANLERAVGAPLRTAWLHD